MTSAAENALKTVRYVAVDDSDPAIRWTGNWKVTQEQFGPYNRFGPPHHGSQHMTDTSGGLTFSFKGSYIEVYGTNYVTNTSTNVDPSWKCTIDGVSYPSLEGSTAGPVNQWSLCAVELDEGDHTLTLAAAASAERPFYVDVIDYVPTVNTAPELRPTTVMMNRNEPAIRYLDGRWSEFESQASLTRSVGAKVRVDFNGTKATWVGAVADGYGSLESSGTYSIDGGSPVTFPIMALPDGMEDPLLYHPFFETPKLQPGPHVLEVIFYGPGVPFSLTYLLLEDSGALVSTPKDVPPLDWYPNQKKSHLGAIVGGAVGGIVLVAVVAILIFFSLKKKRLLEAQKRMRPESGIYKPLLTGDSKNPIVSPTKASHRAMYNGRPKSLQLLPAPPIDTSSSFSGATVDSVNPSFYTQTANPNPIPFYPGHIIYQQQSGITPGHPRQPQSPAASNPTGATSQHATFGVNPQLPTRSETPLPGYIMDGSDMAAYPVDQKASRVLLPRNITTPRHSVQTVTENAPFNADQSSPSTSELPRYTSMHRPEGSPYAADKKSATSFSGAYAALSSKAEGQPVAGSSKGSEVTGAGGSELPPMYSTSTTGTSFSPLSDDKKRGQR